MRINYRLFLSFLLVFFFNFIAYSQPEKVILSFGVNLGSTYPLNQILTKTQENPFAGKLNKSNLIQLFCAYHLSKDYRMTGNLLAGSFLIDEISRKNPAGIMGYNFNNYPSFSLVSLSFGMQRNFYINGHEEFCFFINPNIGIETSRTVFDNLDVSLGGSGMRFASQSDVFLSPVFILSTGMEMNIIKHFTLNIKANYLVSNLGTEDVYGISFPDNVRVQFLPDVPLGWFHRLSASVGVGMNLFRRKK